MSIESFLESPPRAKEVATFDVYLEDMELTLSRLRLVRSKRGNLFISYPSYCVEIDGQKEWHPWYKFSSRQTEMLNAYIFQELKPFIGDV